MGMEKQQPVEKVVANKRTRKYKNGHPAGPAKHGGWMQALRMGGFGLYFVGASIW